MRGAMIFTLLRDTQVRWALTILLIVASLTVTLGHARTVLAHEPGDDLQTCLSLNVDPETGQVQFDCGLCSGAAASACTAVSTFARTLDLEARQLVLPEKTTPVGSQLWSAFGSRGPPIVS